MRDAQQQSHARRMTVLAVFGVAAAILAWRAVDLQFSDREFLQEHGDARYLRVVQTEAHRGMITDRNNEPLAISTPVASVWAKPSELLQQRKRWPELARILDLSVEHLDTMLTPRRKREFVYLRRQVSPDVAAKVEAAGIPGVNLVDEYRRYYPAVEVTGNLLGFTNVDDRGQEGIELAFDSTLRGTPGLNRVIRDRLGRIVELVGRERPVQPGRNLALSIDRRLQYVAYRELKKAVTARKAVAGHMVILDARTGEILALANQPSFNPNNRGDYKGDHFRNRAVTDLFEPGSTLKPFTIAAGLESGLYTPTTIIETGPGRFKVGRHVVRDIHNYGTLDVTGVIEKSSNVGSTKIALSLEAEQFWRMLNGVGFGQITGIDIPGETRGVLPSTDWKRKTYKRPEQQKWYGGETISLGIGQGYNNFTMLQLASATATVAAGGVHHTPHLVKARQDAVTLQMHDVEPTPAQNLGYKPAHVAAVKRGMVGVTLEGTSRRVFADAPYLSGGKTGTAQAVSISQKGRYNAARLAEHQRDHSLYIAFAPADEPKIAVAAIVENAGFGAAHAAPLVRRVMDYWLAGLYPSELDLQAIQQGQVGAPIGTPRRVADMALMQAPVIPH